jgi:trigger factor
MKIDLTDLSPIKKTMTVEVEPEEVARETEEVLRQYRQKARIPGFRPGKAPMAMIRQRFAREVRDDVQERVVARSYSEAAQERGLHPVGSPVVDELDYEDGHALRFKTTFEVLPAIELSGHRGVEVKRPRRAVDDAAVDRALEDLRRSRTQLITEAGRAAVSGDVVVADVEGQPEGGESFRSERAHVEVGAAENLPEFNAGLEGVRAGETRSFNARYPQDHRAQHMAGREVAYTIVVHEVKRPEAPNLDDEFAKDLGEFDSLDALRSRVRADLQARADRDTDRAVRNAILEKVLLANPVPLPEVLVAEELRHRLEDFVRTLILRGVDPEKVELDWKQLREQQEQPARQMVHARLVLDAVARAESLAVSPQEVEAFVRAEAARAREDYENVRTRLHEHGQLKAVQTQLLREKALDYLSSVANIQDGE